MRVSLIKLFTAEQHREILRSFPADTEAAEYYTDSCDHDISRQLVRYWRRIFLDHDGRVSQCNKELRDLRKFISPSPDDDIGDMEFVPEKANRILVIGDLHAPYHHPDTMRFLTKLKRQLNPDLVVQIGDELDFHALSFHDSDPNLDSAGAELERGKQFLEELHTLFPQMLVCHSNHGSMVYRRAKAHGIPVQAIKRYRDIIFPSHGAPSWSWAFGWRIPTAKGPILFKHQTGNALADAGHEGCNVIVGHQHGKFGIEYAASSSRLYFGGNTGCLIDKDALAFAYGKNCASKPIIGALMIIDGIPTPVPMSLDATGRWDA